MKKIYKEPLLRIVDLEAESMLATSLGDESEAVMSDGSSDEQWSNKQNIWDRDGIWK